MQKTFFHYEILQAKQTFMKRARSVAIFSLKLKEKRASKEVGEVVKTKEKPSPRTPVDITPAAPMGELSYIPIEKLIQLEDVHKHK